MACPWAIWKGLATGYIEASHKPHLAPRLRFGHCCFNDLGSKPTQLSSAVVAPRVKETNDPLPCGSFHDLYTIAECCVYPFHTAVSL